MINTLYQTCHPPPADVTDLATSPTSPTLTNANLRHKPKRIELILAAHYEGPSKAGLISRRLERDHVCLGHATPTNAGFKPVSSVFSFTSHFSHESIFGNPKEWAHPRGSPANVLITADFCLGTLKSECTASCLIFPAPRNFRPEKMLPSPLSSLRSGMNILGPLPLTPNRSYIPLDKTHGRVNSVYPSSLPVNLSMHFLAPPVHAFFPRSSLIKQSQFPGILASPTPW